jgi:hypothetical protein
VPPGKIPSFESIERDVMKNKGPSGFRVVKLELRENFLRYLLFDRISFGNTPKIDCSTNDGLIMVRRLISFADQRKKFKDALRSIVIPALEQEVNEGKNFIPLRQVYHSLILAAWYKKG